MTTKKTDETAIVPAGQTLPAEMANAAMAQMAQGISHRDIIIPWLKNQGAGADGFQLVHSGKKHRWESICCAIIDQFEHRRFFEGEMGDEEGRAPTCWTDRGYEQPSDQVDRVEMETKRLGPTCETCPMNEWGSHPKAVSRGKRKGAKACAERHFFLFLRTKCQDPAALSPTGETPPETGFSRLPLKFSCSPSQLAGWREFVSNCLSNEVAFPAAIWNISSVEIEGKKQGKTLRFEFIRWMTSDEWRVAQEVRAQAAEMISRHGLADPPVDDEPDAAGAGTGAGGPPLDEKPEFK